MDMSGHQSVTSPLTILWLSLNQFTVGTYCTDPWSLSFRDCTHRRSHRRKCIPKNYVECISLRLSECPQVIIPFYLLWCSSHAEWKKYWTWFWTSSLLRILRAWRWFWCLLLRCRHFAIVLSIKRWRLPLLLCIILQQGTKMFSKCQDLYNDTHQRMERSHYHCRLVRWQIRCLATASLKETSFYVCRMPRNSIDSVANKAMKLLFHK